jgi:hypothetical protein
VSTQLVRSSYDPQALREGGDVLFEIIAEKPRAHFHLVDRAGSFPFREQPYANARTHRSRTWRPDRELVVGEQIKQPHDQGSSGMNASRVTKQRYAPSSCRHPERIPVWL